MGLYNARVANELLAVERQAITGRTALALTHEISKELGLIRTLAKRLPGRLEDTERATRDLRFVEELSRDLENRVREFVTDASRSERVEAGIISFEELIARVVRAASRIHGEDRVSQSIDSTLRSLRVHQNLERVLLNLLDNALIASDSESPVHVFATWDDGWLRIDVADRGRGMSCEERRGAFELGFTTRRDGGGHGVGLAVSREIVLALGGSIELLSNPGGGTLARVRVRPVV